MYSPKLAGFMYIHHSYFTTSLSVTTFPFESLIQFTLTTSDLDLAICSAILYMFFLLSILSKLNDKLLCVFSCTSTTMLLACLLFSGLVLPPPWTTKPS